jgi:hypothetical protein
MGRSPDLETRVKRFVAEVYQDGEYSMRAIKDALQDISRSRRKITEALVEQGVEVRGHGGSRAKPPR